MQSKFLDVIHSYDVSLYSRFQMKGFRPSVTQLARIVSRSGDGYYYAVVALVLFLSNLAIPSSFYTAMVFAYLAERLVYFSMKKGFKRKRPAQAIQGFKSAIIPSDEFSFPSGHTSAAFVFAAFISFLFPPSTLFIYAWACSVGLSRFLLGVHFLTDIIMGAILGSLIAVTAINYFLV